MNCIRLLYFVTVIIFITACNSTKNLTGNQTLYTGSEIKFKSSAKLAKSTKSDLNEELTALLRPAPNSKILGMRFKLWMYNLAGTPTGHGLRYFIKNKLGEPPVITSMSALQKNREIFQNRLENRGFFHDSVTLDTVVKNKKLTSIYTAIIGERYKIRKVTYPVDSITNFGRSLKSIVKKPGIVKPGHPYDLDQILLERERIDTRLKQRGFYYFNPDYLLANVDSTVGNHKVDIDFILKPAVSTKATSAYHIKDVVVFANYDINTDTTNLSNAQVYDGYKIVDPLHKFRPVIFSRTLVFKPGDVYNRKNHNLSLNRLTTLGVYKFVKARFEPVDTVKGNWLNALYYLTPTEKKSIRLQVSGLTKSNNSNGTEVSLSWQNRNLFKGAELLTASIYGGIEKQISGQFNVSTIRYGIDLNLYVPRIISPFNFKTNSAYVPKTRFNLGTEFFNRNTQYTLTSYKGSYGYQWKDNINSEHQLTVLNINYVKPTNINDSFRLHYIDSNLTIRRSIERQFIIGSIYNYNYNTQATPNYKKNNYYFNANIDLSGNALGIISGADVSKGKEKQIFGSPFSQYIRTELDFRHYLRLSRFASLNSRIITGYGYAYGNSLTMPYIKEFFAGGTNDIRAFRARGLGPGSYYSGRRDSAFIPDQPGDIKLEANLEYRAKLFSIVRYALFVDAGNVWARKEDTSRPGAKFSKDFFSEIAIGAGAGLRFDINILVLRLDLAIPLRVPYLPKDSRWIINKVGLSDIVYNLAIGYPF